MTHPERKLAFQLFLATALLMGAASPPADAPPGWQQITSEACHASFILPGVAQTDTTTQPMGSGRLTRYKYAVVRGRDLYDVTCGVYPPKQLDTDWQRNAVLATMAKRLQKKGEFVGAKKVEVAGRDGRQVVLSVQEGRAMQYHRLVVVGNRLIILTAGRWQKVKPAEDPDLKHFFGSLKLQ